MLTRDDEVNLQGTTPPAKAITRTCMMCKETFESEWSGERICKRCRGSGAWKHPAAYRSV